MGAADPPLARVGATVHLRNTVEGEYLVESGLTAFGQRRSDTDRPFIWNTRAAMRPTSSHLMGAPLTPKAAIRFEAVGGTPRQLDARLPGATILRPAPVR